MTIFLAHPNPVPLFYDLLAMQLCDELWITEQLLYNRKSSTHRFMVGNEWVKMPLKEQHKGQLLKDIELIYDPKYLAELHQKLQMHYGKLTYFDHFIDEVLAVFEEVISLGQSLLRSNNSIRVGLLNLLEWPTNEPKLLKLGREESDASSIDLGLLLRERITNDTFSVIHPYQSKSYQRQSVLAKKLPIDLIQGFERVSEVDQTQNLFHLLFKWGGYHFNWSKPLF